MKDKRIAFLFTGGRRERLEAIKIKDSPEDFFYGALELERRGYNVTILQDNDFAPVAMSRFVRGPIQNVIGKWVGLDLLVLRRLSQHQSIQLLNTFDVIVATTNSDGMALAYLKRRKKIKPAIIFLSMCPLVPEDSWSKKALYKRWLPSVTLGIENTQEIDFIKKQYPHLNLKMVYIPFGVDPAFWVPATNQKSDPYVLTMGNDAIRDFETLINAWKPEYPKLKIITRRDLPRALPINIEVIRGDWRGQYLSDKEIRTHIQNSLFVVIPVKEHLRASGPSVAMQSMGCAKALIMNSTRGLWAPHLLRDRENCLLISPANVAQLQEKIELLLSNEKLREKIGNAGRELLSKHFTVTQVANHIEELFAHAKTN